jgi:hypothetical protein
MRRSWERTWKITLRVGGHIGGTVKHELSAMHDHERPPVTYAEALFVFPQLGSNRSKQRITWRDFNTHSAKRTSS